MHPAPEQVMVDLLISEVYTIGPCFHGGADPGIAAGIDPLWPKLIHCSGLWQVIIMRSLIISPSPFLPKESIRLPLKHNGEI